jgi:hypothetical protein
MAENSKERRERAGADARSQQEADAQVVREKTARLRALRLARDAEAGNKTASKPAKKTLDSAGTAGKPAAAKKKSRGAGKSGLSLSEWLAAQQKDGRHN